MPLMPRDLEGLCPYCEKATSSPARSVYPFCSSLHKSSHTAGHAKHAERRRVAACAGEGESAEVNGLVHRIVRVLSWKSGKHEHRDYTVYRTDWTIACQRVKPIRELYPPKLDLAVTCLECIGYVDDTLEMRQLGKSSSFGTFYKQGGRWPPRKETQPHGTTQHRGPPRRGR